MEKNTGIALAAVGVISASFILASLSTNIEFGSLAIMGLGISALVTARSRNQTIS